MKKILFVIAFIFMSTNYGFSQEKYRISIGFSSICCGTPDDKIILDYIQTFKKSNKIKAIKTTLISGLGREGEHQYVFTLNELSKKQRIRFISKLKEICTVFEKKRNINHDGSINMTEITDSNEIETQIANQQSKVMNL